MSEIRCRRAEGIHGGKVFKADLDKMKWVCGKEHSQKAKLRVPYVVGRGCDEFLLPDAVSEIRYRRANEIPGNNNHLSSSGPPVLYLARGVSRGEPNRAVRRESKSEKC